MSGPEQIKRQSFLNLIATYLGVGLGYLNMGILMPQYFSTTEVGLINFIISTGMLLATFFKFGASSIAIRFLPYYENKQGDNNGFFSFFAVLSVVASLAFVLFYFIFGDWLLGFFDAKSPLIRVYSLALIPAVVAMLLYENYSAYSRANLMSTIPNFIKEVVFRGLVFVAILLFILGVIEFTQFVWLFVAGFVVMILLLWIYLGTKGIFRFEKIKFVVPLGEMLRYGFYILLGGASLIMVQSIDKLMIAQMIDLDATGVYSIAFLFGSVIQAPFRSMSSILEPIISKALSEKDTDKVEDLYQKASLSLYVIGVFFFLIIICNAHNIFSYLPAAYSAGTMVVFIIGLSKIYDMLTSANTLIIAYSSFYRLDLVSNFALVVLTIATNAWLIPLYGINGAAMATLITVVIVNTLKCGIVWHKMRIHPLSKGVGITTVLAVITFLIGYFLPRFDNIFIDTIYRSTIMGVLFVGVTIHFNISPEVNKFIKAKLPDSVGKYIR